MVSYGRSKPQRNCHTDGEQGGRVETFYLDPSLDMFQPERRNGTHQRSDAVRRSHATVATSSMQYEFLRDCLLRREQLRQRLKTRERHIRHGLIALVGMFVALVFGASTTTIAFKLFGTEFSLTLVQIIAVAPFVITYLVAYACTLTAHQTRLEQECWVIDAELQRWGCPTSYSLVRPLRMYCKEEAENEATDGQTREFSGHFHGIFYAHDALMGFGVLGAYVLAAVRAFTLYGREAGSSPVTASVLTSYLLATTLLGGYAVYASAKSRKLHGVVFEEFRLDEEKKKTRVAGEPRAEVTTRLRTTPDESKPY